MTFPHKGDKFGTAGKVLLMLSVVMALVAFGLLNYLVADEPVPARGSAGALQQNSPGVDPPSLAQPRGVVGRVR